MAMMNMLDICAMTYVHLHAANSCLISTAPVPLTTFTHPLMTVNDYRKPLHKKKHQVIRSRLQVSLFPVPLSSAPTFKMPLLSISKVTSICGCPRGAGGIPPSSNLPSKWLSSKRLQNANGKVKHTQMSSVTLESLESLRYISIS